jgi:hypothetical protein
MKNKIVTAIIFVVVVAVTAYVVITKDDRFYLSDDYYNNSSFIEINSEQIDALSNKKYLLFTYNNYCSFEIPCDKIFEKFSSDYNIEILSISFEQFKNTQFYKIVKYAPSVMIISNNKVVAYLDAENNNDVDKYQNVDAFKEWLEKYIYLEK